MTTISNDIPAAVGAWRLSFRTKRGQEHPVVAIAADGTGIYQSPEGPLPVSATFDGDEVTFIVTHKTVMTDFSLRFRGTASGDSFTGAMLTVAGPHEVTGERVGYVPPLGISVSTTQPKRHEGSL